MLDAPTDAAVDAGDHFSFVGVERTGPPADRLGSTHRFRIIAALAGREFETFLLDVDLRRDSIAKIDRLTTSDLPSLAGIDRATHDSPAQLPFPPADWLVPFSRLAEAVGVAPSLDGSHAAAAALLDPLLAGTIAQGHWSPETQRWIGEDLWAD